MDVLHLIVATNTQAFTTMQKRGQI